MHILLVSFFNPLEPNSGSGLRSNCLLKTLIDLGCDVHLFAFSTINNFSQTKDFPQITKYCFVRREPQSKFHAAFRSLLFLKPLTISLYITNKAIKNFVQFTSGHTYDVLIYDGIQTFEFDKYINSPGSKIIINEHNAEFVMAYDYFVHLKGLRQKFTTLTDYFLLKRYEFKALRHADCVIHVSEIDLQHFSADIRDKSVVVPNTLPYTITPEVKQTTDKNVVFIGSMSHRANVEGIVHFIQHIWMDIHFIRTDINLLIVGGNPPPEILKYNGKFNINVLGYIDDISIIYKKSSIAITPVFIGSGSRVKIIEAMMHNTLNISTPKGAEGLLVKEGKHIVIVADKQAWVNSILYYLDHVNERIALEKNAHELVERLYFYRNYAQVIQDCLGR